MRRGEGDGEAGKDNEPTEKEGNGKTSCCPVVWRAGNDSQLGEGRWPAKTKTKTKRDGGKEGRNLKEEQGGSGIINSAAVPKVHQRESCEGGW